MQLLLHMSPHRSDIQHVPERFFSNPPEVLNEAPEVLNEAPEDGPT